MENIDISKNRNASKYFDEMEIGYLNAFFNSPAIQEKITKLENIKKHLLGDFILQKIGSFFVACTIAFISLVGLFLLLSKEKSEEFMYIIGIIFVFIVLGILIRILFDIYYFFALAPKIQQLKDAQKNILCDIISFIIPKEMGTLRQYENLEISEEFIKNLARIGFIQDFNRGIRKEDSLKVENLKNNFSKDIVEIRTRSRQTKTSVAAIQHFILQKINFSKINQQNPEFFVISNGHVWRTIMHSWIIVLFFTLMITTILYENFLHDNMFLKIFGIFFLTTFVTVCVQYWYIQYKMPKFSIKRNNSVKYTIKSNDENIGKFLQDKGIYDIFDEFYAKNKEKYNFYFTKSDVIIVRDIKNSFFEYGYSSNISKNLQGIIDFYIEEKILFELLQKISHIYK